MREIRLALLEADVNFTVVRDFVASVRERALGEEVLKSLTPGQQVVKVVHDELTKLMGEGESGLAFGEVHGHPARRPAGLGQDDHRRQARAAPAQAGPQAGARRRRPAAPRRDRPARAARQADRGAGLPHGHEGRGRGDARAASSARASEGLDTVIVDTAGRLQIDEELMDELERVRDEAKPTNVLLVVDAMTGQEAVNVAQAFEERIAFDGVILTKLDGDARGGAALSGQGGHRQADQVRVDGREARRARGLPSGPHGLAHPRHGRRADADRARRGGASRRTTRPRWRSACAPASSPSTTS